MRVHYCCVYYSELANKNEARTEPYWQSRAFSWAVKTGKFKNNFTIVYRKKPIGINKSNIHRAREIFGSFIEAILKQEKVSDDVLLIPVPSRDATLDVTNYRSLIMARCSLVNSDRKPYIYDGLRWSEPLKKAHERGSRSREELKKYLKLMSDVKGKKAFLIDDIFTKGGTLLASKDVLEAAGVEVLGAITAAKTVYDFNTEPFGYQSIDLINELNDYAA
ncbi:phosphoribosyltransferase family protein [Ochrobactrum sp. EDr1-4]|uniref:phosphoribosyltransferase family protein n=1 Tax=Ochrobactrum sp. EDr1-4 TaxID=3368622 RepID=UPI003BA19F8C